MNPDENLPQPPQPASDLSPPAAVSTQQTPQTQSQSLPAGQASVTQDQQPQPQVPISIEKIKDPFISTDDYEILVIKRHPFGLVSMYLGTAFGLVVALGLLFFLVPSVLTGDLQLQAISWLTIFSVIAIALVFIFLLIATYVYRQNRWTVTNDSIHQIAQKGLFNRQTSELSMANIEDVTAEQKGILARIFGFGTLKAETAGALTYFHFNYCPNPYKYAEIILAARERYINEEPMPAKRANDALNVPGIRRL